MAQAVDGAIAGAAPADAGAPVIDPETWRRLAESADREAFCAAWLEVQAALMPGVTTAVILDHDEPQDDYVVAAAWPEHDAPRRDLVEAGGEAASRGHPLVMKSRFKGAPRGAALIAYPLSFDGAVRSVAVFEIRAGSEDALRGAMTRVQWGGAWLESLFHRRRAAFSDRTIDRLHAVLELVGSTLERRGYRAATSALVTELAARLGCDRVSYGEYRRRHSRVRALSHSGQFGRQMNLIGAIGRAMDEAVDQRRTLVHPGGDGASGSVTRCQEELARRHGSDRVVTVPLMTDEGPVGALCLEFPQSAPVDDGLPAFCAALAALLAPALRDKRALGRNILTKNALAVRAALGSVLGPRRLALKLLLLVLLAGGAWLYQAAGVYNVTADAVLEGAVQRVVAAPFDGYVAASRRRAGDRVDEGEVLGVLDDRDLTLELIELTGEKAQAAARLREARAAGERASAQEARARIAQTDARIALTREQIERTRLTAPFDGIVVSGDLSQSLGAAVERGEVLFEVAPLHEYRVILEVDERDVDHVEVGQEVSLVLSALPDRRIETEVNKVTPVSTAADGRNTFRVEARYSAPNERLRPGMEGVAKIGIGERPLWWIWTRKLVDWLRLWSWRWLN